MIIEPTHIFLRALTSSDAEAIAAGDRIGRSWAPDYPTPGDIGIAGSALAGNTAFATDAMPWGLFAIVETSSGLSVGGIGFKSSPNERGEIEIGYGVCQSFQGRGVATEAALAMCEIAQRGARTVLAETDRENAASQRVLEKCGFVSFEQTNELIRWRRDVSTSEF